MYAKLANGAVERYPYTMDDLRRDYPNTSFPAMLTEPVLDYLSMARVIVTGHPAIDHTQNVTEGQPVYSESRQRWEQQWIVTDASAEEIAQRTDAKSAEIRAERNRLLALCDWTQLDDSPISNSQKLAWAQYRQSLRDLTSQAGFPWQVAFPDTP